MSLLGAFRKSFCRIKGRYKVWMAILVFGVWSIVLPLVIWHYDNTHYSSSIHEDYVSLEDWQLFQLNYRERFHRMPPSSLRSWLAFAKHHNCEERNFYAGLEHDLQYFRQQINATGVLLKKEDVLVHTKKSDNHIALSLENNHLSVVASKTFNGNMKEQDNIEKFFRWLLEPVAAHRPPLNATYFFHLHDSALQTYPEDTIPIFSVCKMSYFTDNQPPPKDISNLLLQYNNKGDMRYQSTKLFQPDEAHHADVESFASHDLMIPYYNAYAHVKYTVNPFPPRLSRRKDAIVWRGSTTGGRLDAPRFELVRKFGGKDVHPIDPNVTTVMADFAFAKNVQSFNTGEKLRFAGHKYYFQLQQYKYILDVDGNGKKLMDLWYRFYIVPASV